jgi:hypothetical protein
MTDDLPPLDDLLTVDATAEALLAWCHHAAMRCAADIRDHAEAFRVAAAFGAPSLGTASTAQSLARAAFLAATADPLVDAVDLDIVALAAARLGEADHASVGTDACACIIIAGLAAGRLTSRLRLRRHQVRARRLAQAQFEKLLTLDVEDTDFLRGIAIALGHGTTWKVVDRLALGGSPTGATASPAKHRAPQPSEPPPHIGPSRRLVTSEITVTGDRDTKAVLERCKAVLEAPVPLIVHELRTIEHVQDVLDREMSNFKEATAAVCVDLLLAASLGAPARIRPTLVAGPPGIGKSRWTARLGELLKLPSRTLPLAGSSDSRFLAGTARGWGTSQPSGAVEAIVETSCANVVLVGDELDKAGGSERNGRVDQTILALLEPHTARRWYDECLRVPVDLSLVSWLFTANDSTRLSSPLQDRLRIVHVDLPAPDAFDGVLATVILDIAIEFEVDHRLLPALAHDAVMMLRRLWTRSRSPRRLRNAVLNLLSGAPRDNTLVRH